MLTKEEYKTLVNKIHYSLSYHEADEEVFNCLEKLEELIEKYFYLKKVKDRLLENGKILNDALREYQRKYGD